MLDLMMAPKVKRTQRHPANLADEVLSVRFADEAENYAAAAIKLGDEAKFHNVRYHLFCHAFELIFKSFILSAGGQQSLLFSIGHRLNEGLAEAIKLGYKPSHQGLDKLVDWLHPYHAEHDFRYARGGYTIVPTANDLLAAFKTAHAEIAPLARANYQKRHPLSP
jgi:hypothetical protein